jgi:hypothetical protein
MIATALREEAERCARIADAAKEAHETLRYLAHMGGHRRAFEILDAALSGESSNG